MGEIVKSGLPCESCSSSDAAALYTDGFSCFSCGYGRPLEEGESEGEAKGGNATGHTSLGYRDIRGISAKTCSVFKYSITKANGENGHLVHLCDGEGNFIGQKLRFKDKRFKVVGNAKNAGLTFLNIAKTMRNSPKIVITEGELDALSVAEVQGCKWPVVSLPNGVSSAAKACMNSESFLKNYKEIILLFDNDWKGKEAAREVSKLFPTKVKIAELPLKDANEMLLEGRGSEIVDAIFKAKPWSPEGVVTLGSLKEQVLKPVSMGKPWIFDTLTNATYGRREGELYFIGAGSGIGKTDFMLQQATADINSGDGVAMFLLEQPVAETGKRLAGKLFKKRFHVPDAGWTTEELADAFDKLSSNHSVFLYDHFGSKRWDEIAQSIRFLALAHGVKHFYVDHLTALVANAEDERREIERITSEMSSLAQELSVYLYVVSHLATPEGKPHEEGGRVMAKHFKGSRSIIYWAHFMFGLERDTQAEDEETRQRTVFRCLKDRFTGGANGLTFSLAYDEEEGWLFEKAFSAFDGEHEDF